MSESTSITQQMCTQARMRSCALTNALVQMSNQHVDFIVLLLYYIKSKSLQLNGFRLIQIVCMVAQLFAINPLTDEQHFYAVTF